MANKLMDWIDFVNGNRIELRQINGVYFCVLIKKKDGSIVKKKARDVPAIKEKMDNGHNIRSAFFSLQVEQYFNPTIFNENGQPCGRARSC